MKENITNLWEEKNSTELEKKFHCSTVLNQKDITTETKKKSDKKECIDITKIKSGIYKIINKTNGKYYVGSAVNFKKRWREHRNKLNKNKHNNLYLQHAWNKCGSDNFEFLIVEYVDNVYGRKCDDLLKIEQKYLDIAKSDKDSNIDSHYNICYFTHQTTRGIKLSEEHKNKLSMSRKGKKHSIESRKNMSKLKIGQKNSFYGKTHSKETLLKISKRLKGKIAGEKHPFYGKNHTIEHKNKIKESLLGRIVSDETRKKLSNILKGKKRSSEIRKKFSEIKKGIPNLKNRGEKNGSYDNVIHHFYNKRLQINRQCTCYELTKEFNLLRSSVTHIVKGKIKHHRGWILLNNNIY